MSESDQGNAVIISLVVVALLAIAGTAAIVSMSGNQTQEQPSTISSPSPATNNTSVDNHENSEVASVFRDGVYESNGSYMTPGGTESIDLKLTLKNDVITNASLTQNAKSNEAKIYQAKFATDFKAQVVGKKIDEVNLSRVSGSSLTPMGFNKALDEIENQAKA